MRALSDYWQKKLNQLEGTSSSSKATSSTSSGSGNYWDSKMTVLETKTQKQKKNTADIAPYRSDVAERVKARATVSSQKKDKEKKWYQKGLFEDGYDFGDVTKTILGVDEDSASLKDLTVNSFKKGYYNSRYGEESYKAMTGSKNEKDVYKKILEGDDYQFAPGNDFAGGVSGAFELLGQQYRQFTNPRTLAFTGTAAGAAALAGQAGPQVLLPEEIITVPAAATAAFTASSAASNYEIEAGHAYNEMIEAGINEETARKVALGVGAVNASLEMLQVDELLDAYKVTKASGATKSVSKRILDELVERGVDVAKETGQEVLQEGSTVAGVQLANKLDKGEFAYSAEEVASRLLDTAKSSALSFGMMNVPATAKNTYSIVKDQNIAPIHQEVIQAEEKPDVAEVQPEVVEKPKVEATTDEVVKPQTDWREMAKALNDPEIENLGRSRDEVIEAATQEVVTVAESGLSSAELAQKSEEAMHSYLQIQANKTEGKAYTEEESALLTAYHNQYTLYDSIAKNPEYLNEVKESLSSAPTVAENSTVEQQTQLTEENSTVPTEPGETVGEKNAPTVSETESVDAKAELDKLYDERQVLEDTISSLVAVEDLGDNYIALCERLTEVDQKIAGYEDMVTNLKGTTADIAPVPTPEPTAPYWFSEEIASVVGELSSQDTGDMIPGKQDVFEINGYKIQRRLLRDGKRLHYSIISPDGTARYNIIDADKDTFYGDVAQELESIMRIDFEDEFEQQKPGSFAADAPVRVVPTEDGDYLKTDQFTEETKPQQNRAKILTEMPKQKPKVQEKKTDSLNVDKETTDGKKSPLKWFEENIIDHGFWVEKLSKKTNNRELEAKWDGIRRVRSAANYLIGKGGNGVKSLKSMMETVEKAGLTQDFYDYLGHYRNIDGMTLDTRFNTYNKGVWGDVSAAESQFEVDRLEKLHPEFKEWADDVWAYNRHLRNEMVRGRLISQKLADRLAEMYPHYVPLRRVGKDGTIEVESTNHVGVNSPLKSATGGNANIMPLFNTMAEKTMEVYKAVAMNKFGLELYNTLYPGRLNQNTSIAPDFSTIGMATDDVDVDYTLDGFDPREELLQSGKPGSLPTFSIYIDGERHTMDITSEMYTSLKPTSDLLSMSIPVVSQMNTLRRNLITTYNLWFGLNNAVKDTQDVLINSQHPLKTYATYGKAIGEMVSKGKFYQEYVANGGEHCTYFDTQDSSFDAKKGVLDYVENMVGLKQIIELNNYIEMLPRLSEYIASREEGRSVEVSMLDAARVTTNFGAGGKVTKFLDRNGATFLNSSVQGFVQQARNVAEAKQNGIKGFASLAARYLVAGLPAVLLNKALWEDDEDYQALPDYITDNYYIPFKYGDGQFVRIPKGRTAAVIQNAIEQVAKMSSGDDEADWNAFFKLFMENIAPNNPLTDNILAPIIQTATNTTWYGEDIIPYRLKDLPASEQFDEKTDDISIWLGEKLDYSPKKINYLLDQYSGVLGDTFLPMLTPKAESPIDNPILKLGAPFRDRFTTDSVLNNRVTGDFYETLEAAEKQAESENASKEDKFKSGMLIGYNVEISKLMQEQRDIQTSDLPDSEKYKRNREIKKEINALQEKALEALENYSVDGNYAEAGDKRYNYDSEEDTWWEVKPKLADGSDNWYYTQEQLFHDKLGVSYSDYWNGRLDPEDYDVKSLYGEYGGKRYNFDMDENSWFEIKPKTKDGKDNPYYQREQLAHEKFGVSYEDFWNNREAYSDAVYVAENWGEPFYETVKSAIGVEEFAEIASGMADIKADKDENGESISGTRKKKMQDYIYGLDIPDIDKHILFKAQYPYTNTHSYEIVEYLDKNDDISYESFYKILDELGYKYDNEGRITWGWN